MALRAPRAGVQTSGATRLRRGRRPRNISGQVGAAESRALAQGSQALGQLSTALAQQETRKRNYAHQETMNDFTSQSNEFASAEGELRGKAAEGSAERYNAWVNKYIEQVGEVDETTALAIESSSASQYNSLAVREQGIARGVRRASYKVAESNHLTGLNVKVGNIDWASADRSFVDNVMLNTDDFFSSNEARDGLESGATPESSAEIASAKTRQTRVGVYNSLMDNITSNTDDTLVSTQSKVGLVERMLEDDTTLTDTEKQKVKSRGDKAISDQKTKVASMKRAAKAAQRERKLSAATDIGKQLAEINNKGGDAASDALAKQLLFTTTDPELRGSIKSMAEKIKVPDTAAERNRITAKYLAVPLGHEANAKEELMRLRTSSDKTERISEDTYQNTLKLIDGSIDKNKKAVVNRVMINYKRIKGELDRDEQQKLGLDEDVNGFLSEVLMPMITDKNVTQRELADISKTFTDTMNAGASKESMKKTMLEMQRKSALFRAEPGDRLDERSMEQKRGRELGRIISGAEEVGDEALRKNVEEGLKKTRKEALEFDLSTLKPEDITLPGQGITPDRPSTRGVQEPDRVPSPETDEFLKNYKP